MPVYAHEDHSRRIVGAVALAAIEKEPIYRIAPGGGVGIIDCTLSYEGNSRWIGPDRTRWLAGCDSMGQFADTCRNAIRQLQVSPHNVLLENGARPRSPLMSALEPARLRHTHCRVLVSVPGKLPTHPARPAMCGPPVHVWRAAPEAARGGNRTLSERAPDARPVSAHYATGQ